VAGRPSKLTPEVSTSILEAIAKGVPRKVAARGAGVSASTLRRWEDRGWAGDEEYAAFAAGLQISEAQAAQRFIGFVLKHADSNWRCALWWLERQLPEEFGPNRELIRQLVRDTKELKREVYRRRKAPTEGRETLVAVGR
jgi:hypothetical protein